MVGIGTLISMFPNSLVLVGQLGFVQFLVEVAKDSLLFFLSHIYQRNNIRFNIS